MAYNIDNVIVNLKSEIAKSGGAAVEALTTRVQTLESTVGDETGGLVKDVDDLVTVVGDETGGLVKDVGDLQNDVETVDITSDYFGTLPEGITMSPDSFVLKKGDIIFGNIVMENIAEFPRSGVQLPIKSTYSPNNIINSYVILKNSRWNAGTNVIGYLWANRNDSALTIQNNEVTPSCKFAVIRLYYKIYTVNV